jgi:hypothetical protein
MKVSTALSTGGTLRAALPFADSIQRSSMESYLGYLAAAQTRVTCAAPTILAANISNQTDYSFLHAEF